MMIELPPIADGEDKHFILANRIRKNYRLVRKWAKKSETNCFRIYDREIRQFPFAIDYYAGYFCIHYFPRPSEEEGLPAESKAEVEKALLIVFGAHLGPIFWRTRQRTKETRQYEKRGEFEAFFTVIERGVKFKINLTDYLDTGLFLDHRETRKSVASHASGKRVLNLFAYTCSFSVHAAMAGAIFTKSVDMSNTYTAWGADNFKLNHLSLTNNVIVRDDCLKFLTKEIQSKAQYDIIIIDPPTISRSKKMDQLFDVQVDYIHLIQQSLRLLAPEGILFFSTNSRKFVFDQAQFKGCKIQEISSQTLPPDFHDPKIHRCWKIGFG